MRRLLDARANLLKMPGGKLIAVESVVLAVLILVGFCLSDNLATGLIISILFVFFYPALVGLYEPLAKVASVVVSVFWGLEICLILADFINFFIALIIGVAVFFVGYKIHQNYGDFNSGGMLTRYLDYDDNPNAGSDAYSAKTMGCPYCDRRIPVTSTICDYCGKTI
jgi:hypothetical protein